MRLMLKYEVEPRRVLKNSSPACFGKGVSGQMQSINCLVPFGSLPQVVHSHMCSQTAGKKEYKGSTPSWSHPPQITIPVSGQSRLTGGKTNKETVEFGKAGLEFSGLFVLTAGATGQTPRAHLATNRPALARITHARRSLLASEHGSRTIPV